ncbi:hypothetical protein [Deinococcus cellulosilyticus]|uniref:Lipoprotein n=1 Tax=Deinococcus cellulosilyticus (strain DSM 18568 / NBRC 106333 / KACC 11606 / 5516J-15) TaxID=1223518 RepID=A0A511N334_DEIC1|nr:hypothetical protein [Deinococcus cellulosilyticus]GEM47264.1 hypothetical protein DC3_28990 [Deinococcus cellulosilyticus NBRC 106333 = KACC 11606]
MKKPLLFALGLLLAACGKQVPAEPAQNISTQGTAICSSQVLPSGHAVTSIYYSYGCRTSPYAGSEYNTYTIENLAGRSTFNGACDVTYPPSGWVVTGYYFNSGCNTSAYASYRYNTYNLVNTAGKTQLSGVCALSSLPSGWTVTSRYYSSGCNTSPSAGYSNNTYTIRKL